MATVEPFHGWLVTPAAAPRVVAPAYDALTPAQRAARAAAEPDSFLHVLRAPEDQLAGADGHRDRPLQQARAALDRLLAAGAFVPTDGAGYHVLRMRLGDHVQTGVVGRIPIDEVGEVVRLHEDTRPEKEAELVRHLEVVRVASSPVGLVHPGPSPVADVVAAAATGAPDLTVEHDDGLREDVWTVTSADALAALRQGFAVVPRLYLTDGHHRVAAARRVAARRGADRGTPAGWLLAVVFAAGELRLFPYHRVVHGLARPARDVVPQVAERFDVRPLDDRRPAPPTDAGCFAMYAGGRWHAVRTTPPLPAPAEPVADLDVSILQERILGPVLGVDDARTDARLEVVPGTVGLPELARRAGADGVAFALPAPRVDQLIAVADAGAVMPPKSTWSEPKVRSGMFLYEYDDGGAVG